MAARAQALAAATAARIPPTPPLARLSPVDLTGGQVLGESNTGRINVEPTQKKPEKKKAWEKTDWNSIGARDGATPSGKETESKEEQSARRNVFLDKVEGKKKSQSFISSTV